MLSRNMRVTLIEDDIAWGDREANIKQLERNLRKIPKDTIWSFCQNCSPRDL